MSATRILWGQILVVFALTLAGVWAGTQWTAHALGYQAQLGAPWFSVSGAPVYPPYAIFWWWFSYEAYAPRIFEIGGMIAASGGLVSVMVAIGMSVWRAREIRNSATYGSARWATRSEISRVGLLAGKGVIIGQHANLYLRHDGPEHVLCFAPTRSGKGGGLVVPTLLTWPHSAIVHDIKGENWELVAVCKPGDAICFLGSTVHGAGPNQTEDVRRGVVIGYSLGWLKPYENLWLAYPPAVAKEFSPELAELAGYVQHRPNLGNFEGQCPSVLLRDEVPEFPQATDSLRPDQKEAVREFAETRRSGR